MIISQLFRKPLVSVFYLFMPLAMTIPAAAQPTIESAEKFSIGDRYSLVICDTNIWTPGLAGASQTWDYRYLLPVDTVKTDIIDAKVHPLWTTFPAAQYAKMYTFQYADANLEFFNITGNQVSREGTHKYFTSFSVHYPSNALIMELPVTYNAMLADTFTVQLNSYTGVGYAAFVADGWGELMLPGKTYTNVLRVKRTFEHRLQEPGTTEELNVKGISYAWYHPLHKEPLLKMDSTFELYSNAIYPNGYSAWANKGTAHVLDTAQSLSVSNNEGTNDVYAGFLESSLIINGGITPGHSYGVSIYTIDGRVVEKAEFTAVGYKQNIPLQATCPPGLYVLVLNDRTLNLPAGVVKLQKF